MSRLSRSISRSRSTQACGQPERGRPARPRIVSAARERPGHTRRGCLAVAQLVDELGIVGELELPPAMGRQAVRLPDASDRAGADAGSLRHHVGGPVCGLARRVRQRLRHHAYGHLGAERGNARWPRLVAQQSFEACRGEALLPAPHAGLGLAGLPHDLDGTGAVSAQQDDLGAPDVLLRRIAIFDDSHQSLAIGRRNGEGYSCTHAPDSHALSPKRIPHRALMLGYIRPIPGSLLSDAKRDLMGLTPRSIALLFSLNVPGDMRTR